MSAPASTELVVASPPAASLPAPARRPRRRLLRVAIILGLLIGTGGALWAARGYLWSAKEELLLTCFPKNGPFAYEVTERGELESSANLEVRCEVESRDGKGMKIIEIVPEGTVVKEGDLLVRFDDSGLRNERIVQQIAVNAAEAAVTTAANGVESAEFAKREYELGTFIQEDEKLEGERFVAEENLRRAEDYHNYTKKLETRGYASPTATEADAFAVEKSRKELGVAETKLKVLREYTKVKTLKKHDADIRDAKAKLKSEQSKLELETEKLAKIDTQIEKCIVLAPRAGQAVYDHEQDSWRGNSDYVIKEGTVVYERRVVIRLPDATKMQVKTKIAESKIDRLKIGMPATIQVEGLPGKTLEGRVTKVNDFPAQGMWFNQSIKEYETTVDVVNPPTGLRPGMTAQVAIQVERLPEALQVPVQAVAEISGRHYCLVKRPEGELLPRRVTLGTSNDKFLVIREGVAAQDELLLDPRTRLSKMTLPMDVPETEAVSKSAPTEPQKPAVESAAAQTSPPAVRDSRT